MASPAFRLVRADLLDLAAVERAMEGVEMVFHLAANADVRFGPDHPRRDLEQNAIATWNVLEGHAPAARPAHRLLIHRLGLRGSYGHSHPGGLPVPGADFALRGL